MQALSCDAAQQNARAGLLRIHGKRQALPKQKRPASQPGAMSGEGTDWCQAMAFSTTALRQGFSAMIASSEARMLAPAAMMKTLSQWPEVCCM